MSSISSSDRARQDDRVRQTREEYESREADSNKRRQVELSRLEKRHNDEINRLSDEYESRIDAIKSRNRETINDRDHDNNRKIENVRQAYREALKTKMEDHSNQRQALRDSYEGTIKKNERINSSQRENLKAQLNDEISRRDEKYGKSLDETRTRTQEVIRDHSEKLKAAHAKERDTLIEGNDKTRDSDLRQTREMKRSYEARLRETDRRREADNAQWAQKYKDTVVNSREQFGDDLSIRQQILDAERESIRNKFDNVLNNKLSTLDEQNEQFRDTVNGRVNSQVRSRDSKIERLSNQLNNEMAKNERLRGVERRNLTEAYEKRIGLMNDQRDDAIDRLKELNDERISKTLTSNEKLLRGVQRDGKTEVNTLNTRHRADRETLLSTHKDMVEQVTNQADRRVRSILDTSNKNNERMGRYYSDSLEQMKENYLERMDTERQATVDQRLTNNKDITQRFRTLESGFNNKLEQTTKTYESKIADLKDNQARELKRLENLYAQRLSERDKMSRLEKESITQKYEAKLAQSNESHQDQLDRMNRRHDEDMQNLAVKVNSYNRKA